jgi:hypothetical protein
MNKLTIKREFKEQKLSDSVCVPVGSSIFFLLSGGFGFFMSVERGGFLVVVVVIERRGREKRVRIRQERRVLLMGPDQFAEGETIDRPNASQTQEHPLYISSSLFLPPTYQVNLFRM